MKRPEHLGVYLNRREAAAVIRLLGVAQGFLEEAIDGALVPGTRRVFDAADRGQVAADRERWRRAEDLVGKIDGRLKTARREAKRWR